MTFFSLQHSYLVFSLL